MLEAAASPIRPLLARLLRSVGGTKAHVDGTLRHRSPSRVSPPRRQRRSAPGAAIPSPTTAARHPPCGASTPWWEIKLILGVGVREARRASKSKGPKPEVAGAIRPRGLQLEYDATVRGEQEPILRHGRPPEIAAELLEALAIRARHGDVGVKVEAVKMSVARATGSDPPGRPH